MGWKSRNEPFVRHPTPSSALTPNHFMDLSWDPPGHCGEIPLPQSGVLIDVPLPPLQTPELLLLDRDTGASCHRGPSPWEPQCCPCSGILNALLALTPPFPFPLFNFQQAPFFQEGGRSFPINQSHDGFIKLIIPSKPSGPNLLSGFLFSLLSLLCRA